jgi:Lsr2
VAKRVITVDDLTGRETETKEVEVTVNGKKAKLDLSPESLAALEALVSGNGPEAFASIFKAPTVPVRASKSTRSTSTANGGSGKGGSGLDSATLTIIREWARGNGYADLKNTGRLAQSVIREYDAANGTHYAKED